MKIKLGFLFVFEASGASLGRPWASLRPFFYHSGVILEPLGPLWGASGPPSDHFLAILGAILASLDPLSASLRPLLASCGHFGFPEPPFGLPQATFSKSWHPFSFATRTANREPRSANRKPRTANRQPRTVNYDTTREPRTAYREPRTPRTRREPAENPPYEPQAKLLFHIMTSSKGLRPPTNASTESPRIGGGGAPPWGPSIE